MKAKTIKQVIRKKVDSWLASITDETVRKQVEKNIVVTGGSIASMLLGEPVNDFDLYFTDIETTTAVANYYVNKSEFPDIAVSVDDGRVRITTPSGHRGEILEVGEIEDKNEEVEEAAQTAEDKGEYRPVFFSTNAITLTGKLQLILRFYGEPDLIHENYDFIHCTNYWTSKDGNLVLRPASLEALLTKELRYVGSKYPLCSIIRLRKFIKRGWCINAGQILKMVMQCADLDLKNPAVLEDQLTGVDALFFIQVVGALKEKNPDKVDAAYLVEIIDRMF